MDLKLKEVAELLNVSEITIRRWLADGKIPAYRIHHQYRFSRTEIENWIISHRIASSAQEETKLVKTENIKKFGLFRAINNGLILEKIYGSNKEEILHYAAAEIGNHLGQDPAMLKDLLLKREDLQTTALNNGFALPHTRNFLLNANQDCVVVAFLKNPIEYDSFDRIPVKTLFFLFACDERRHLSLLSKIANLCNDEKNQKFIHSHPSKKLFLDYVKDWEDKIY
jgi:PTS system nitrogen regulatory IIA component